MSWLFPWCIVTCSEGICNIRKNQTSCLSVPSFFKPALTLSFFQGYSFHVTTYASFCLLCQLHMVLLFLPVCISPHTHLSLKKKKLKLLCTHSSNSLSTIFMPVFWAISCYCLISASWFYQIPQLFKNFNSRILNIYISLYLTVCIGLRQFRAIKRVQNSN